MKKRVKYQWHKGTIPKRLIFNSLYLYYIHKKQKVNTFFKKIWRIAMKQSDVPIYTDPDSFETLGLEVKYPCSTNLMEYKALMHRYYISGCDCSFSS
jgi:hypothetical protein